MTASPLPSDKARDAVNSGTIVRRANTADLAAVIELAEASSMTAHWSPTAAITYCAAEEPGSTIQAKAIFVACARSAEIPDLSALEESGHHRNVVGFAAFSAVTGSGPGECALENLAVAEQWRRQGIGARLLAAGMLWCSAQLGSSLWLEVRASNREAIALYERAAFTVAGRRPGYYTQPDEDAIEMRKIFDTSA